MKTSTDDTVIVDVENVSISIDENGDVTIVSLNSDSERSLSSSDSYESSSGEIDEADDWYLRRAVNIINADDDKIDASSR